LLRFTAIPNRCWRFGLTQLQLGVDVHCCRLPFGGGVLVNGVTLAVAEFGDLDLAIVALGVPPPEAGLPVRRLASELLAYGWFSAKCDQTEADDAK
jgi:hypothetical protein